MKNRIEKVKLYVNHTEKAEEVAQKTREVLLENEFVIVEEGYELAIAIGGDGSFLRMIKENNFNDAIYYVGINAGTLGFLQEIRPEQIYEFVSKLRNKKVKIEEIGVQETNIYYEKGVEKKYSLNEILIREKNLNVAKLSVCIDEDLLEHFTGDGLLITTSVGSTAYNLSFGGSIVYSTQIGRAHV